MIATYKKVGRHGNSLALVIPATICQVYDIKEGTMMQFAPDPAGRLVITPHTASAYKLKELLAQCATPGNVE